MLIISKARFRLGLAGGGQDVGGVRRGVGVDHVDHRESVERRERGRDALPRVVRAPATSTDSSGTTPLARSGRTRTRTCWFAG